MSSVECRLLEWRVGSVRTGGGAYCIRQFPLTTPAAAHLVPTYKSYQRSRMGTMMGNDTARYIALGVLTGAATFVGGLYAVGVLASTSAVLDAASAGKPGRRRVGGGDIRSTTASGVAPGGGAAVYESSKAVDEYLLFHFGEVWPPPCPQDAAPLVERVDHSMENMSLSAAQQPPAAESGAHTCRFRARRRRC